MKTLQRQPFYNFEELPVWKESIHLLGQTYAFIEKPNLKIPPMLRNLMERNSVSISTHIADGTHRSCFKGLLEGILMARTSAVEFRSLLCYLQSRPACSPSLAEIEQLKQSTDSCLRQLKLWIEALEKSEANAAPATQRDFRR